ncbi:hypothetical protein GJ744_001312 [Endocarpon pusillum]|uniref:Uncharacterized protein n=1 Tax=Endocarpon pusillum TaxID=364733 RepID=A0A8H7E1X9_9EURO|nr:hypothetical protein GJ744_001312 [Endocarpon pusillum]
MSSRVIDWMAPEQMTSKQLYWFVVSRVPSAFAYTSAAGDRHEVEENRLPYDRREYCEVRVRGVVWDHVASWCVQLDTHEAVGEPGMMEFSVDFASGVTVEMNDDERHQAHPDWVTAFKVLNTSSWPMSVGPVRVSKRSQTL